MPKGEDDQVYVAVPENPETEYVEGAHKPVLPIIVIFPHKAEQLAACGVEFNSAAIQSPFLLSIEICCSLTLLL